MPKSSKSKEKQEPNIEANINIGGDVSGSNIIVGHGNTIINEALKTEYTLFSMPLPVADFTGRDREIESLKASFKNGALISGVSGGGGIGKTELARRLAKEIAEDYPDARMSIDLRGTSDPLAPDEAMRRLIEPFYPNQKLPDESEQLKGLYQQTFSAQKALILLDNASNAAQIRSLIPSAPSAAIVTSRQHITLTEFDLMPLRLDVLSRDDSCSLLKSASSKLRAESDEEINALAKLCGYLPLALRVAASILNDRPDWTLGHLLTRLADEHTRLQRLKREDDIDLDVEAALSLSYALLDETSKAFFCQLGVFTAPFIKVSAQVVCESEDEIEVDDLIGKLSSLSLLNILPSSLANVSYMYELHDLTRLFSIGKLLKDESNAAQTSLRHAYHFLQWAAEAREHYIKGNENALRALFQFRFIWPHLDSAYNRLLPEQESFPRPPESDADAWLCEFPNSCALLLDLHLSPRRRIPILETALNAARRLKDKQIEGIHLGSLGLVYAALGNARKGIEFYEQRMVIAREIGDRQGEGNALGNLGVAYKNLGDARKAIEFHEQALVIFREISDRRGEGAFLGNLGVAYAALGDARKAIEFFDQALVIDRDIGNFQGEGTILGNLGNAYAALGDARKAIEFYEQALVINRVIGDRQGEGGFLINLGLAHADLGDARKAIEFYQQALFIVREIGDRRGEGNALGNLGSAYVVLGDAHKGIEFYEQRIVIAREIGDRQGEGAALGNIGSAYYSLGDAGKAIEFYEQRMVIAREIGDRRGESVALFNMGSAYENLGYKEKAIQYTEQALAIFEAIESPYTQQARTYLANLRGE
ncbi:MAG: tetratricopeptide repeat protein [Anaerolineales bacterium]|nr:tetratricopeptide repeat protein [Anaerolineales bacterium]